MARQYSKKLHVVDVTLSLTAAAHVANDVLEATRTISQAVPYPGGSGMIKSIVVINADDASPDLDFIFLDTDYEIGTQDGVVDITDAEALRILGTYSYDASALENDLIASRVGVATDVNIPIKALEGSHDIYFGVVLRGGGLTPTASGITVRFFIEWDL
jgi:hypothetical protein